MSVDCTDLHTFLPPFQPPECGIKIHSHTDSATSIYCTTTSRYSTDGGGGGGGQSGESDHHHVVPGVEDYQRETAPCFVQFEFSVSQVKRLRSEPTNITDCPTPL